MGVWYFPHCVRKHGLTVVHIFWVLSNRAVHFCNQINHCLICQRHFGHYFVKTELRYKHFVPSMSRKHGSSVHTGLIDKAPWIFRKGNCLYASYSINFSTSYSCVKSNVCLMYQTTIAGSDCHRQNIRPFFHKISNAQIESGLLQRGMVWLQGRIMCQPVMKSVQLRSKSLAF